MRFLKNAALAALLALSVFASSAQAAPVCVTAYALLTNMQSVPKAADSQMVVLDAGVSAKIGERTNFPFPDDLGQIAAIMIPGAGLVVMFPLNKDGCALAADGSAASEFETAIYLSLPVQQFETLVRMVAGLSV